jgi:putative ABC transport system permease protein
MFHQWRAAARSLARRPGLTTAVVVTLALGIGANSAIFSAVDAVLLKPLPFPDADRLVAFSQVVPVTTDYPPNEFHIIGRDPEEKTFAHTRSVSAGYFRTLRIPILQGETCSDDPAAPPFSKALVTRAFADRFFGNEDPRGHGLTFQNLPPGQTVEILGVVGDVRERGLLSSPEPIIYTCGYSPYWPDPIFLVRTDAAHPASVAAIRAALREIEPRRAVYAISPLAERLRDSVAQPRLNTMLLTLFAAVALLLAALGLYGVLSQLVAGRRREIGVRMALGEPPARILRSVVMQAAAVTVAGIACGLAGAFAAARLMASLVFDIPPLDPLTFAAAPAVLSAVALATAFVPARRAALVNPVEALRE